MKIIIQNNCYSKYKENKIIRSLKKTIKPILGSKNLSKVKTIKVKMMGSFYREKFPFIKMWNPDSGIATLTIFPNWLENGAGSLSYSVMHELVHLRDVMNEKIIEEKPLKGEKIRIWFKEGDEMVLYNRVMPEWVSQKLFFDEKTPYRSFLDHIVIYYPWEKEALLSGNKYTRYLK